MEEEFGSCAPVRFLKPLQVKVYDHEDNEIEVPKCEHCGYHKTQVIALKCSVWICCNCVVECEKKP